MSVIKYKVERDDMGWIADDILEEETVHAMRAVGSGAFHLKTKMAANVSGAGTGRFYKLKDGTIHRASEEGGFPAKMRGNLAKAIRYSDVTAHDLGNRIRVQSHVMPSGSLSKGTLVVNASARILEFGGLVGKGKKHRIMPRPFIRLTVEQERARILDILEE